MRRLPAVLLGGTASLVLIAGLALQPRGERSPLASPAAIDFRSTASPPGPGSALPQLHASSRGVILSWVEREGSRVTLKFAERMPDGWSGARVVASGDDWFVNWADVPSVVQLADGTLAAHWLQKSGPGTYAYDVRLAWSSDGGITWSAPASPHDDGTQTEHGFASLFQTPDEGLGVVWLDGRETGGAEGHGHGAGAMSLRAARYDRAHRRTSELPVDRRVCDCCPTAVAVTTEGPIVAYRDRSDAEVRDIFVTRLVSGTWTDPTPLHADGWEIHACPVNGPALAAAGQRVAAAWFTARGDAPRAFVAFSDDGGRRFGAPVRLDDRATLGRVGIVILRDGTAAASYMEHVDDRAELRVRRIAPSGERRDPVRVATVEGSRASGYPRVAYANGELLVAWTETTDGASIVRTAAARID